MPGQRGPGHVGGTGAFGLQPSPEAVREELERTVTSAEFVASDRLKDFLRFVVEEALAGRADHLKAYTIAVEVFGRDPRHFDPQTDPVVRMEAGKLRIAIPKGSYAPTFGWQRNGEPAAEAVPDSPASSRRRFSRHGWLGLSGLALAGLVLGTTIWLRSEAAPTREAAAERFVDGKPAGELTRSAFRHGLGPFELGRDSITSIDPAYKDKGQFPFTGTIEQVTFDLTEQ